MYCPALERGGSMLPFSSKLLQFKKDLYNLLFVVEPQETFSKSRKTVSTDFISRFFHHRASDVVHLFPKVTILIFLQRKYPRPLSSVLISRPRSGRWYSSLFLLHSSTVEPPAFGQLPLWLSSCSRIAAVRRSIYPAAPDLDSLPSTRILLARLLRVGSPDV